MITNPTTPDSEVPSQGPETIAEHGNGLPAPAPRNQFVTVPEPKNKQFTGRATETEYSRINAALAARKQAGTYDIVRFCLDMMNHIEDDFLQTFTTK